MSKHALVVFGVVVIAGVGAVLLAASRDERDLAFTLGVAPSTLAAELSPGTEACQRPVVVGETFTGVRFQIGTYERSGSALAVTVRPAGEPGIVARGTLQGGYPDVSEQTVRLDRAVDKGQRIAVCARNVGDRRIAIYGGPELAKRNSSVVIDRQPVATDMTLVFTRESRSALAQVPDVFERASAFRPVWVGPWTFWALAGLLLIAVPALLAVALRDAFRDPT